MEKRMPYERLLAVIFVVSCGLAQAQPQEKRATEQKSEVAKVHISTTAAFETAYVFRVDTATGSSSVQSNMNPANRFDPPKDAKPGAAGRYQGNICPTKTGLMFFIIDT